MLDKELGGGFYIENGCVEFDGGSQYSGDDLEFFVEAAKKAGMTVNGTVDYFGDYEGRIKIKDNEVTDLSREDAVVNDASDEDLITELESRGYTVSLVQRCPIV